MKKLIATFIALFAIVGVAPAQAEGVESIVIIDSNFDESAITGDFTEVCLVAGSCANVTPRLASQFKVFNHGTIMANIARANNPSAKLVLINAASPTSNVNAVNLETALDWVIANRESLNIKSVSFSANAGSGSKCLPLATGVNVKTLHGDIVSDVQSLSNAGTKVYAASGNYGSGNNINYPACIDEVVAVGSTMYRGSQLRSDIVMNLPVFVSSNLKSIKTSLQDSAKIDLVSPYAVKAGNTTSVATVVAAATYK
jgi:hypothetical protein